jgi:hypothetical protein
MPEEKLKFCSERGNLLDDLNRATSGYSRAAADLGMRMGTFSEFEYKRIKATVEQARLIAERVREALMKHREEHGC